MTRPTIAAPTTARPATSLIERALRLDHQTKQIVWRHTGASAVVTDVFTNQPLVLFCFYEIPAGAVEYALRTGTWPAWLDRPQPEPAIRRSDWETQLRRMMDNEILGAREFAA